MSTRIIYAAGLAAVLWGCGKPPAPRLPTSDEVLVDKCAAIARDGRMPELVDEHQRWVRDCQQSFYGAADAETAKERMRLALEYHADRELQRAAFPVAWSDVAAAARKEVAAVDLLRQDGDALVLSARWRREVSNDRGGALALACKAVQVQPELFAGQLTCGDYVLQVRQDVGAAVKRWRAAFPHAANREEQCQVVERLLEQSLHPDEDSGGHLQGHRGAVRPPRQRARAPRGGARADGVPGAVRAPAGRRGGGRPARGEAQGAGGGEVAARARVLQRMAPPSSMRRACTAGACPRRSSTWARSVSAHTSGPSTCQCDGWAISSRSALTVSSTGYVWPVRS